jgi:hypothetical protein
MGHQNDRGVVRGVDLAQGMINLRRGLRVDLSGELVSKEKRWFIG